MFCSLRGLAAGGGVLASRIILWHIVVHDVHPESKGKSLPKCEINTANHINGKERERGREREREREGERERERERENKTKQKQIMINYLQADLRSNVNEVIFR